MTQAADSTPVLRIRPLLLLTIILSGTLSGLAWADSASRLSKALLQNENFKVRLKAAKRLGKIRGNPKVVRDLVIALTDPHHLVRAASANALGKLNARDGLPGICAMQRDAHAFTRKTAAETLKRFGGPSACVPRKVYVSFRVTTAKNGTAKPDTLAHVESSLRALAGRDARIVMDAEAKAKAASGGIKGINLRITVDESVDRSGATVKIGCMMVQAVFDAKLDALRGSARQRANVDLGTAQVSEAAISAQQRGCIDALVPVVHEGLTSYLDRLK